MTDFTRDYFRQNALALAESLIGKTLVNRINGVEICGIISETEAYIGVIDKASHAYNGRRTKRTETMFNDGGYAYVYLIYGMYCCMNVTANVEGVPEAVLIRAVYPTAGRDALLKNYAERGRRRSFPHSDGVSDAFVYSLSNGPGKLCNAFAITRGHNGLDMLGEYFFLRDDGYYPEEVLRAPRVGIDYAEEAAQYPWRFTAPHTGGLPLFKNHK